MVAGGSSIRPSVLSGPMSSDISSGLYPFEFADLSSSNVLTQANMLFDSVLPNGRNSCMIIYNVAANSFGLVNDSGADLAGSVTPGMPGTVSNSQCVLDGARSAVSTGLAITRITLALNLQPGFYGFKYIWGLAINDAGLYSNTPGTTGYISLGVLYFQ